MYIVVELESFSKGGAAEYNQKKKKKFPLILKQTSKGFTCHIDLPVR